MQSRRVGASDGFIGAVWTGSGCTSAMVQAATTVQGTRIPTPVWDGAELRAGGSKRWPTAPDDLSGAGADISGFSGRSI